MADLTPTKTSVSSTAVVALSGAGAGDTIMWVFDCLQQGHLITPPRELAMVWGAALMPLGHALYRKLLGGKPDPAAP